MVEPGPDKVDILAARYAAGLPLHHDGDRQDHAPRKGKGVGAKFGGYHHNDGE